MIYVFAATVIYTFVKQKDELFRQKRNLVLYLFLTLIGFALGIIYIINPYLPSITSLLEKYME
jgi:multisubunit Na+/H+ antiporter MnhB subunit